MEPRPAKENLHELYVDHLVVNLESRPVGAILDLLSRYCGWEEIFAYVYEKVKEQRERRPARLEVNC